MKIDKTQKFFCNSEIAILMATYNGEKFIAEQIESIIEQSFKDWELFIHDDGSSDNTACIINRYANEYPNKIHIISGESNGSAKKNFFYLMSVVEAKYIMFADQDDYWDNRKIEITYQKMKDTEKGKVSVPVLVFSDLMVVDSKLNVINDKMSRYQNLNMQNISFNKLIIQNIVTGCTVMINRECLIKSRVQKTECDYIIMHDWWCALVASYFGKIGYIDESLILYRQHGINSVGAKKVKSLKYIIEKLRSISSIKTSITDTQIQIKYFMKIFNIRDSVLYSYINLNDFNHLKKILFLIKNNILKSGFLRNIGFFLFV